VRGYPLRATIGRFPDVSVEQARAEASGRNAALSKWKLNGYQGDTLFETKRDPTLDELVSQYVEKQIAAHSSNPERASKADEQYEQSVDDPDTSLNQV
jgi:hypothetical protein